MAAGVYEVGRPARLSSEEAVTLEAQWQDFGAHKFPFQNLFVYRASAPVEAAPLEIDASLMDNAPAACTGSVIGLTDHIISSKQQ